MPNEAINQPLIIINIIILQLILVFSTQATVFLFFLRKRDKIHHQRKGSMLCLVAFPNALLFPLPIVLSLFGSTYIAVLVIFSLSALVLRTTLLTYQCIYYGKNKKKTILDNLKEMVTFPPTLMLVLSIILNLLGVRLNFDIFFVINEVISQITSIIGALLIGLLLVNMNFKRIGEFKKDFLFVFTIRVFFSFLLFLLVIPFFTFPTSVRQNILVILLILFIDPPAVTNIAYSEYFELDREFTAFAVFTVTIMAVVYIPVVIIVAFLLF
ncbi:MAG: hypothetical protein EU539_04050 [Promethearchaeota archaeon]|nr:MAG: hypothetical protein EU539_04050 [Candidatus Lokiarchaeota archaeon]